MKVIVFNGDSGSAQILTPNYPKGMTPEEEAQLLSRLQVTDVMPLPDGSQRPSFVKEVDSPEITRMSMLYSSWKVSDSGDVYWNADTGREIKRGVFRALRKPLLEKLDVQFMRALEDGDTATIAAIAAKKKTLRDVTLIDLSQYDTPETLNAFTPEVLKEN
jgi:hypothetical protein